MYKLRFLVFLFIFSLGSFAQVVKANSKDKEIEIREIDSIKLDTILLDDVFISKEKFDPEAKKQFLLLQNRVFKVYPFAKIAADRLSSINSTMDKLKSNK